MGSRVITHPLLLNKRSRFIFICFFLATAAVCAILWREFYSILSTAGIGLGSFPSVPNRILKALLSPMLHLAIAVVSAFLGGVLTAVQIVGPVRRIQEWLEDVDKGREVKVFEVRWEDDIYKNIIHLMNNLRINKPPHRRRRE